MSSTEVIPEVAVVRALRYANRRATLQRQLLHSLDPQPGARVSNHTEFLLQRLRRQCDAVLDTIGFRSAEISFRVSDYRKAFALEEIDDGGAYLVSVDSSFVGPDTEAGSAPGTRNGIEMCLSTRRYRAVQSPDITHAFATGEPLVFWRNPEALGLEMATRFPPFSIYWELMNYFGALQREDWNTGEGLNAWFVEVTLPVNPILITLRNYQGQEENVPRDAALSQASRGVIARELEQLLPYQGAIRQFQEQYNAAQGNPPSFAEILAHLCARGYHAEVTDTERMAVEVDAPAPFPFLDETMQLFQDFQDSAGTTFRLAREQADIYRRATTDPLTGLYNRQFFMDSVDECFAQREPFSLVVFDLDHFKQVNDTHGHDGGDLVLRAAADRARGAVRSTDLVARLGGEEFGALLPGAELGEGVRFAERMREVLGGSPVGYRGTPITITGSFGVACNAQGLTTTDALYRAADTALYAAKHGGRNRVSTYNPIA